MKITTARLRELIATNQAIPDRDYLRSLGYYLGGADVARPRIVRAFATLATPDNARSAILDGWYTCAGETEAPRPRPVSC